MIAKMLLAALFSCDPVLTRLFTPPHPQLGNYEVCTTPRPISSVAPAGWAVDTLQALDAFGSAGPYDKSALARVYGGRRAQVARGWNQDGDLFESVTMISPYPDASLTRLMAGTMEVRFTIRRSTK